MASAMYAENPTFAGAGLVLFTAASRGGVPAADAAPAVWPYVTVGLALVLFGMALSVTGSVGLSGSLRFCAAVMALACGVGAWRFFPSAFPVLGWVCLAAAVVVTLWGFGHAWWIDRASRAVKPP